MYRRNDPRFRRTLNEISQTLESANESAQANIFTFSHHYVGPCLSSVYSVFQPCVEHCFPPRDPRAQRYRRRSVGRAEVNFDFYDDWEEDENDGLLGWGDSEYDGLLGGGAGYGTNAQPARQRAMSYGTRKDGNAAKRKSALQPYDTGQAEAQAVPSSSYFGLFGRLTSKIGGGKNLRYKPSAAGLQEHPGVRGKTAGPEGEPLFEESEDGDERPRRKVHNRKRSATTGSGHTTDSLSSRGDIFPSDDEDDAVPLDDEFAMVLERRTTNSGLEETSSRKSVGGGKRPSAGSRKSTQSSRRSPRSKRSSRATSESRPESQVIDTAALVVPTLTELKQEEEQMRVEEEVLVQQRRDAAQRLAADRGLASEDSPAMSMVTSPAADSRTENASLGAPSPVDEERTSLGRTSTQSDQDHEVSPISPQAVEPGDD